MRRFQPICLAFLVLLAATGVEAAPADAQLLKRGRAIAQKNCGGCHAIGARGESANPKSPPFRQLARKYPLHNLEESLGEGIVVGHEGGEMPQFRDLQGAARAALAH